MVNETLTHFVGLIVHVIITWWGRYLFMKLPGDSGLIVKQSLLGCSACAHNSKKVYQKKYLWMWIIMGHLSVS